MSKSVRRNQGKEHGMTERVRAVGYIRVSTEEQARDGYGLDAQRRAIQLYCEMHQLELIRVYEDAGVSGKSTEHRDGLLDLLREASTSAFDRVVFLKLDRLSRRLRDILEVCDTLERHGVQVVSIQEGIDATATGKMIRNVLGTLAEFERETIVGRIKDGIREKAQQGEIVGPVPLGYLRDEDGSVTVDPVIAPLIEEMFKQYATGQHSLRDMTRWAGAVGLRSRKGSPLDRMSIRKMLANATYTGMVVYYARRGGGVIGKGKHRAIVDAATFATVQEVRVRRRRVDKPSRPFGRDAYPLTKVAVCGYDASPLVGTRASKTGRRYMRCSTAHRRGKQACQQRMVPAELLEAQLGAYIEDMQFPTGFLSEVVAELRRMAAPDDDAASEQKRLQREFERLKKLYRLGDVDDAEYKRESAPLKRRLAELDQPHVVLDVEHALEGLRQMGQAWKTADRATQRDFVRQVFKRIVVHDDQLLELTPHAQYAPLFRVDRQERFGGDGGVVWLPGQDSNLQPIG